MTDEPGSTIDGIAPSTMGVWVRVYLHGILAMLVLAVLAYVIAQLAPVLFPGVHSTTVRIALSALFFVVFPPLFGVIVVYGLLPLIARRRAWRGVIGWDERLFGELESAKQRARVVAIDWPGDGVRTIGVLTSTFEAESGERELGAVYVPTVPQTRYGYVRVVPVDELEFTGWTLGQWRAYQMSFGSVSPPSIGEG